MSEIEKDRVADEFDGDKILSEYGSMTRDDVIDLLGDKYSSVLRERIEQGNINFDEFTQMCNEAFPNSPQRANWVRNMIFNRLSKTEGFNMIESDTTKRQAYAKMEDLREKAKSGKLTETELKELCETAFGKDSKEAKSVYDKMIETGRVKPAESKTKSDEYQQQVAEVTRDNDLESQKQLSDTQISVQSKSEKSREDNKFIQDLKQQTYTPEEIARNDAKAMESPVAEQPVIQAPVTQGPEMVI